MNTINKEKYLSNKEKVAITGLPSNVSFDEQEEKDIQDFNADVAQADIENETECRSEINPTTNQPFFDNCKQKWMEEWCIGVQGVSCAEKNCIDAGYESCAEKTV